jgi:Fe-S-cluster containining protein
MSPTTKKTKTTDAPSTEWWHDGVRFECQGSGKCCVSRGQYGFVYVNLAERKKLAELKNLSLSDFTKTFCSKTGGWFHFKNPGSDCQFLQDNRCSVYEARPTQCRTWPFWPQNMKAKAWKVEVASYCPGVGKGPIRSRAEIEAELKASEAADGME